MQEVINTMYDRNPEIKNILENGYDAFPQDWYDKLSDKTPSGIDMRITGTLVFWFYRYGEAAVVNFIMQSALREKNQQYWERTVSRAFQSAEKFYVKAIDKNKLKPMQEQFYNRYIRQRFKKS